MASVVLLQLPTSQPEFSALSDLLTTDSTEINWIFSVIVIDGGIKNLSLCKTWDPQVGPDKGRMLDSGKCKLGDNPMRASECESKQRTRGAMSSRPSWHLELPGSIGSDHGLFQLSTKGGVELGDLCVLSVQSQSQHHSPVSG